MSTTCPKCGFKSKHYALGSHVTKCGVTQEALFWARVNKDGPNGCWVWTGYCQKFGHGWTHSGLAHRYAWTVLRGPLKPKECLLHHCDNPPCVNPDHLFIGDRFINGQDAKAKGRTIFGTRSPKAVLTEEQAQEILATATGVWGEQSRMAKKYGVGQPTIAALLRRRSWPHLKGQAVYCDRSTRSAAPSASSEEKK